MGLNVYISNDLERLVSKLNERSEYLEKQIFQKDHFIVQTEGLRRWLSVQMAINSGVFANFHFTPPNSLIYDLFGLAKMQMPELFTTNNLKWLIYNILSNTEFKNLFPEITAYYENDNIKQLQLATKLSDLFDQYTFSGLTIFLTGTTIQTTVSTGNIYIMKMAKMDLEKDKRAADR